MSLNYTPMHMSLNQTLTTPPGEPQKPKTFKKSFLVPLKMSLNWPSSILHHLVSTKNQKLSKNFLVPVQMSSNRPSFILHHLVSTKNFQKILFGPPANDIKLNSCANELKLNSCANELKLNSCANEPKLHSYAHELKSNSDHTTW